MAHEKTDKEQADKLYSMHEVLEDKGIAHIYRPGCGGMILQDNFLGLEVSLYSWSDFLVLVANWTEAQTEGNN